MPIGTGDDITHVVGRPAPGRDPKGVAHLVFDATSNGNALANNSGFDVFKGVGQPVIVCGVH
jgi:hypothetical protein